MTLFGRITASSVSTLSRSVKTTLAKMRLFDQINQPSSTCCVCRCYAVQSSEVVTVEDESTDLIDDKESYEFNNLQMHPDTSDMDLRDEVVQPVMWDRRIPRSLREFQSLAHRPIDKVANPRVLKVSLLGSPNAGKSTLTNQIMGWRVASVSSKVHTTRRNTLAIMTENNVQIILVDTPGVINADHGKKHHLERSLVVDPEASLTQVDLVAVVVDASAKRAELGLDPLLLSMLYSNPLLDSVLILNKVDLIGKKTRLLEIVRVLTAGIVDDNPVPKIDNAETFLTNQQKDELLSRRYFQQLEGKKDDPETKFWKDVEMFEKIENNIEKRMFVEKRKGWPRFKDVFMVSALTGDGTDAIKNHFMKNARLEDWRFSPSLVSNQSPKDIALMAVREKLLDHLRMKLPYQIELFMKEWSIDDRGTLRITVKVKCPRPGAMKHVMGEGGKRVRQIAYEAGQEMMNSFRCEVLLKLIVAY